MVHGTDQRIYDDVENDVKLEMNQVKSVANETLTMTKKHEIYERISAPY
jgi:hypothetical protein